MLFRSMTSYGGTYSTDGNEITHHVFGLQMCQFHRHFRRRRALGWTVGVDRIGADRFSARAPFPRGGGRPLRATEGAEEGMRACPAAQVVLISLRASTD